MTDAPLMAGTYVLVTRGTGGIGKATVAGLAALGVRVGITGRDQGRAAAAAADIRAATGNHAVDILPPTCPPRRRCAVWPLR
jgi:retinol dehydrogenase 14